jgi:hypothetical protein
MLSRVRVVAQWLQRRSSLVGLIMLQVLLLSLACGRYLLKNNSLEHDLVGHWAAAAFTERYLFPSVSGYNPFYYCGVPQNLLYPPLLAYFSAALGRLVGLPMGLKLTVVAAVLATPWAAFWCARAHSLRRGPAIVATLLVVAELALDSRELGGTLLSTFVTGNAANAVGLPLFLAYAASLARLRQRPRAILLPTILLGCNLVAHLVAGLVAIALLLAHVALAAERRRARLFILHGLWAFALACFFILPMLAFQRYGSAEKLSYNQYPDSLLLVAISFMTLVALYVNRRKQRHAILPLALLCGALLLFHAFVFNDYFPRALGLHVHRFKLYDTIGLTIIATWLVSGWLLHAPGRMRAGAGWCVAAIALVGTVVGLCSIDSGGIAAQRVPKLEPLNSRVMVVSSPLHQVSDHALQHLVAMKTGNAVGKGLFIESSANSRLLVDLELLLAKEPMSVRTWGVQLDSPERLERLRPELLRLLEFFGFGYVVSNEPLRADAGLLLLRKLDDEFTLYRANYAGLAEVWPRAIRDVTPSEFAGLREQWLWGDRESLVIERSEAEAIPAAVRSDVLAKAQVKSVRFDSEKQRIELYVGADEPVPVLLKFTYMPQFKARDKNGHGLPLFRVAPNFMLVVGHGPIVVSYERTPLERWSYAVSMLGWLAVLGAFVMRYARPLGGRRAPVANQTAESVHG